MAAMHFCLVFRFQQPNLPALRSVSTTAVEAEAVVCLFDEVAHGERLVSRFGTHAVPIFWGHGGAETGWGGVLLVLVGVVVLVSAGFSFFGGFVLVFSWLSMISAIWQVPPFSLASIGFSGQACSWKTGGATA